MARRGKKGKGGNATRAALMTTHKTTGSRPFGKGRKGGMKRKGSRY